MPRSQQLVEVLKDVVKADLQNPQSVIGFFVNNTIAGGWEIWLQTVYARGVFAYRDTSNFNREVTYPGTALKCDLWFQGGTGIWIELKTQRSSTYTSTVGDFAADVHKILNLSTAFRQTNVNVAMAVMVLSSGDRGKLNEIRTAGPAGTLKFFLFTSSNEWADVTDTIATAPVGRVLLATYRFG